MPAGFAAATGLQVEVSGICVKEPLVSWAATSSLSMTIPARGSAVACLLGGEGMKKVATCFPKSANQLFNLFQG